MLWSFVQLQAPLYTNIKMTWLFYIVNVSGRGVRGSSPTFFVLNGVKPCNFRQEKYGDALS